MDAPFEVWYAPGDSEESDAASQPFTKVSNSLLYGGADCNASFVGFIGKVYEERRGEPLFFVERNVADGSVLREREGEGV